MRRTLVQFDEDTYRKLRQHAFRQERSMSSLVREIVAKGLEGNAGPRKRTQVAQFASVGAGRSRQGRLSPVSEKHDDALASSLKK
jgi:plasmid stability protein